MAEGKNSFVLYTDYINIFDKLTDEEAGKLAKHLFAYVNDRNPKSDERLIELIFEPIKQQLKRDLKEWENRKELKSTSGRLGNLKRWNNDLYEQVVSEEITLDKAEEIAVDRKTSHCDSSRQNSSQSVANIAVTDTVTVTVIDNVDKEETPLPPKGEMSAETSWKKSFEVYIHELRESFKSIKADKKWIDKQESFNPGVDIVRSIEKSCVNYWATEAGWKKKVRSRSTSIDWKSTFANAVSQPVNRIYKDRIASTADQNAKKEPYKPEKW